MAGQMKVHLFQVKRDARAQRLEDLLRKIVGMPLDERIRVLSNGTFRLENAEPPRSEHNDSPYWLLDFVKLRFEHGPGKVGKRTALEGFALGDDEGFGEETAALFDPETSHMVVQYSHHGMRASAIERYFNVIEHNENEISSYELLVKLDQSAEIRLARKKFISQVAFKIAPPRMTEAHRRAGVSLQRVLELNNDQRGGAIEIAITAPRGETLSDKALLMIDSLRGLTAHDAEEGTNVVSRFEVTGKDDPLDRADAINMITPKLEVSIKDLQLGGDRRYTKLSRWNGLIRARRGWSDILKGR